MFEEKFISFANCDGALSLSCPTIFVDDDDFPGVQIAAGKLAEDFGCVTRTKPAQLHKLVSHDASSQGDLGTAIIVGSIQHSRVICRLQEEGKLSFDSIHGKWESFATFVVDSPFKSGEKALVIAGSDKRGAIFGIYTLSEQIGVSPWHYWADVPAKHHPELYAIPKTTVLGEPSIRYRGIFLNDEAPALMGWAREKFGGLNTEFYKTVYELLLRLKANFLWPAMWPGYPNPGAVYFLDDPENQKTAEEYGICMSTSHHEPMQKATTEWFTEGNAEGSWDWTANKDKMTKFFHHGAERAKGCETYFTMGMRGEYDRKVPGDDPAGDLRDVIQTQRKLFRDVYGADDAVPQLLALYKEVQDHFESGRIDVPDDVTLLFADDNYGTIRRLPTKEEAKRKGGAGIYYHFEYVGWPRSYKWVNSNSLGKAWQQLMECYHRDARQIWVFNVGDLKPLEVPISFAMALAYNVDDIPATGIPNFMEAMAERDFGADFASDIGAVWHGYDQLASLRKHESIEADTFSLLHYSEAQTILDRWKSLLTQAESIYDRVPEQAKVSAFELVVHPVKASWIYVALRIHLARNQMFARQRRNSANTEAKTVLDLFDMDFDLSEEFHSLLGGKWNQILCQPHYGFGETWHAPSRDMISGLCYVQKRQWSNPIVGQMGVAVEGHEGVRPGRINEESERTHPSRRDLVPGLTLGTMTRYEPAKASFEVFTRGPIPIHWSATVPYDWMSLSCNGGTLVVGEEDAHVDITVDWDKVPDEFDQEVLIDIRSEEGDFEQVHMPINGRRVPSTLSGCFVEGCGYVSIPPASCDIAYPYRALPDAGRTSSGSVSFTGNYSDHRDVPFLTYRLYTFTPTDADAAVLTLQFGMTLDLSPGDTMSYDLQIDDSEITNFQLKQAADNDVKPHSSMGWFLADGWFAAAGDGVWYRKHVMPAGFKPGEHTIKIRLRHSNIMLEKLVVDLGGVKPSYLGPPASHKI
ncbi:hypothetical protein F4778DRAFT_769024 [Xylariomycetidae sp. FL2044]|nr:hypothetical protein F4778DRAFT_769024 [Xylariomycetidae sp. FL2044]